MIVKKLRGFVYCYLDAETDHARAIINWLSFSGATPEMVKWAHTHNCDASFSNGIVFIRPDTRPYITVRFRIDEDAVLFRLRWEEKFESEAPPVDLYWPLGERADDPKGFTFGPWTGRRYWKGRTPTRGLSAGLEHRYYYATERNAAGYFVAWEWIEGEGDTQRFARRKKKDVIEWARKKATGK